MVVTGTLFNPTMISFDQRSYHPKMPQFTKYSFLPASMLFAELLNSISQIMKELDGQADFVNYMLHVSISLRIAINKYGFVRYLEYGDIYACEVDGFGSHNLMDDERIPRRHHSDGDITVITDFFNFTCNASSLIHVFSVRLFWTYESDMIRCIEQPGSLY